MNKTILGVVIGLFIVGGVAVFALNNKDDKPSQEQKSASSSSDSMSDMPLRNQNSSPAESSQKVAEGEAQIEISNLEFKPATLKVKKGTKVTWTNQDSVEHDVAPDSESNDFVGSELLSKGESYSFTFDSVGTFSYHCTPHPQMKALVEVTE